MRRVLNAFCLALLAGALAGCESRSKRNSTTPSEGFGPESEILERFHAAVREEVFPEIEKLSANEIQRRVADLAQKHLVPHKDELAGRGTQSLERLPILT